MFVQEVGGWVLGGTQTHIPIFTSMYCLSGYKFTWEGFPVNLQLWGKAELFSLLLFMDLMIHGDWIKIEISQEIKKQICIPSTVVCRASLSTCPFSGPTTIVFMAMQWLSSNSSSRKCPLTAYTRGWCLGMLLESERYCMNFFRLKGNWMQVFMSVWAFPCFFPWLGKNTELNLGKILNWMNLSHLARLT